MFNLNEVSTKELEALKRYLGIKLPLHIRYSNAELQLNLDKPRYLCAVDIKHPEYIHCSYNLNNIPRKNRIGILLHELGHIVLLSVDEVLVDEWCKYRVPEAGFYYEDSIKYLSYPTGFPVEAKNIEAVSKKFLTRLFGKE